MYLGLQQIIQKYLKELMPNMEILLLGALMVGLPIIIMGSISAWRERQYKEYTQK